MLRDCLFWHFQVDTQEHFESLQLETDVCGYICVWGEGGGGGEMAGGGAGGRLQLRDKPGWGWVNWWCRGMYCLAVETETESQRCSKNQSTIKVPNSLCAPHGEQVAVFQDHESEWMGWVDIQNNSPIKDTKIKLGEMEDGRNKERNDDEDRTNRFFCF